MRPAARRAALDPAVLEIVRVDARRCAVRVRRALIEGDVTRQRARRIATLPLTARESASRDAWKRSGLSAFDATMLALQLGERR